MRPFLHHLDSSKQTLVAENGEPRHEAILRYLLPFVWPKERTDLRIRVVLAVLALVASKIVTIAMPIAYKSAVDGLTAFKANGSSSELQWAAIPIFFILAYGLARISMIGFVQLRDVLFTQIGQHATRVLTNET